MRDGERTWDWSRVSRVEFYCNFGGGIKIMQGSGSVEEVSTTAPPAPQRRPFPLTDADRENPGAIVQ